MKIRLLVKKIPFFALLALTAETCVLYKKFKKSEKWCRRPEFSWKTASHEDHLEVRLPNSRLLSGLIGMWSFMKVTKYLFSIICRVAWRNGHFMIRVEDNPIIKSSLILYLGKESSSQGKKWSLDRIISDKGWTYSN